MCHLQQYTTASSFPLLMELEYYQQQIIVFLRGQSRPSYTIQHGGLVIQLLARIRLFSKSHIQCGGSSRNQ